MHPIEIIHNTPKWYDWTRVDFKKDKDILLQNQLITIPDPTGEKWAVYPISVIPKDLQENNSEDIFIHDDCPVYVTTGRDRKSVV